MRKCLYVLFVCSLMACNKDEVTEPDKIVFEELYKNYNGRYHPVTSVSNRSVDIDLDGTLSENILLELPELQNSYLQIQVLYDKNIKSGDKYYSLLSVFWPEQFFLLNGETVAPEKISSYDPAIVPIYLQQSLLRKVEISNVQKEIGLLAEDDPESTAYRLPVPDSVSIGLDNQITVISTRKVYTKSGWETIQITTVYDRYTNET